MFGYLCSITSTRDTCVYGNTQSKMGNLSTRRTFNIWYALYIICKSGWVALFRAEWFRVGVWGARPKALHAFGSGRHRAHLALMRLLESSCSMISAPDHFFPVSAFPVAIPICHGVYVGNMFQNGGGIFRVGTRWHFHSTMVWVDNNGARPSPVWQQVARCVVSPRPRAVAGNVSPLCMGSHPQAFQILVPVFNRFHSWHMCAWEHIIQAGGVYQPDEH